MCIQYTTLGFEPMTFGTRVSLQTTRAGLPPFRLYFYALCLALNTHSSGLCFKAFELISRR